MTGYTYAQVFPFCLVGAFLVVFAPDIWRWIRRQK